MSNPSDKCVGSMSPQPSLLEEMRRDAENLIIQASGLFALAKHMENAPIAAQEALRNLRVRAIFLGGIR